MRSGRQQARTAGGSYRVSPAASHADRGYMPRNRLLPAPTALGAFAVAVALFMAWAFMAPRPIRAQSAPSLAAIGSLSCSFPVSVSVTWENGEPQPELKKGAMLT